MTTSSAAWRALTPAQQSAWTSLGLQMTRTDSLGQTYKLTGAQAHASVNNISQQAGSGLVTDAPSLTTPEGVASVTLTLSHIAFSVAWTPTPLQAGQRIMIRCSPQRSAGRTFEGDYRVMFTGADASASPANILAAYTAKFGAPVTGNKIFVQVSIVQAGFESGVVNAAAVVA